MMGSYTVFILFAFLVDGVFGDMDEVKSVIKGDSVTLNSTVTKEEHDIMKWYFNEIRIVLINGDPSKNCLYNGPDGIFKDKLKVDFETGSLTINNIRPEHSGRYEAKVIRSGSSGNTQSLNQNRKCNSTKITPKSSNSGETIKIFSLTVSAPDSNKNKNEAQMVPQNNEIDPNSDLSPAALAEIAVAVAVVFVVLLVAAAVGGVIFYRCRMSKNEIKKNNQGLL